MVDFNTHELAWCAGFFDGEGSTFFQLHVQGNYSTSQITLDVAQVNPLLLRRFNRATGKFGNFHRTQLRTARFEYVQYVMCLLWKYLGPIKKEQYRKASKEYLLNCWKPKFDKLSVYKREYSKYGSKAMMNKVRLANLPQTKCVNPFEKTS